MDRHLIGVDPNPSKPGEYNIEIEGIMSCFAIFATFDGEKWDIPEFYFSQKKDCKVWWYS